MPDSKPADVPAADLDALRASLDGDAVVRGDSAWEAARQAWNLVAVQEPALVVMAELAGDVAATVGFARDQGLQIAPQSTGHGAAPLSDLGSAVPPEDVADGRLSRSTRGRASLPLAPVRNGARSAARRASTASPACTARRGRSGSPDTR